MKSIAFPYLPRRLLTSAPLRTVLQIAVIMLIWLAAAALTRVTGLPVSPGVVGLLAMLALLLSGRADILWVKDGAEWLLGELVLFFIPCVVAVMQYGPLFRTQGVQIMIAVAAGTLLVMAATALAVHAGCQLEHWIARRTTRRSQEPQ